MHRGCFNHPIAELAYAWLQVQLGGLLTRHASAAEMAANERKAHAAESPQPLTD